MDPQFWQAAVAVAVPAFGVVASFLQKDRYPGVYRNLRLASAVLKELPESASAAREAVEDVVVQQARILKLKEAGSLGRRLNIANVIMSLILSGFGGWASIGLLNWSSAAWGEPEGWLVVPVSVILGLLIVLLIGAAWATIYNTPKRDAGQGGKE